MNRNDDRPIAGRRTLETFATTPRLNGWLFSQLSSEVRGDVLEIGSGIGNISRLIRPRASHLVVSDTEPQYLRSLTEVFFGDGGVEVVAFDLERPPPPGVSARTYDTIVAINVLEHILDDQALVIRLAALLRPGGRLAIYVPACPAVYSSLDVALGHHRRYTPATLTKVLRSAALDPQQPRYVNLIGLAGWFLSGRVLKRSVLSSKSVRLFDHLVPLVRLEDRITLPIGLGLCTSATKPASARGDVDPSP